MTQSIRAVVASLVLAALLPVSMLHAQDPVSLAERSLRPGDALQIQVWPNAELGGTFFVEETGYVYLPFLEAVPVAGISLSDLRVQLREGYSRAIQNPVVTITPLFAVTVMGAVNRPGIYRIPPTSGIMEVLGEAGGFNSLAKQDQITIVRQGQVIQLNAIEAFEKGDLLPLEALTLRSGDNIYVPQRSVLTARDWLAIINTVLATVLLVERIVE